MSGRDLTQAAVRLKAAINDALAPHDAMAALVRLSVVSSLIPPSGEPTSPDLAEYIAAVLLERPTPAPIADAAGTRRDLESDLALAQQAAGELRRLQSWAHYTRRLTEEATLDMLAFEAEHADAFHRWPGDLRQARHLLAVLFESEGEVADALRSCLWPRTECVRKLRVFETAQREDPWM